MLVTSSRRHRMGITSWRRKRGGGRRRTDTNVVTTNTLKRWNEGNTVDLQVWMDYISYVLIMLIYAKTANQECNYNSIIKTVVLRLFIDLC
jgi:hypothetical protein